MKGMILLAACGLLFTGAFCQDSNSMHRGTDTSMRSRIYVTLSNGKVMLVRGDNTRSITSDKTLSDGTVIHTNGTISKRNGQTLPLREGQKFYIREEQHKEFETGNKHDTTR